MPTQKQIDDCAKKFRTHHAFYSAKYAKRVASRWSRELGMEMVAYRCSVCGLYHIARKRKRSIVNGELLKAQEIEGS